MLKKILNPAKYVFIFGITAFLLWKSFDSINEEALAEGETKIGFVLNVFKQGDYLFFGLSAVFTVISHVLRAERWRLLLNPIGFRISLWNSFTAVMNGYFINLAIPRGGEVSRPVSLYRLERVPVTTSLGTVVMERVIDLFFLMLCVGIVFLFQFQTLMNFIYTYLEENPSQGGGSPWTLIVIVIGFLGVVILAFIINRVKPELFKQLKEKFTGFLLGLKSGVTSIFKLKSKTLFFIYSIGIWWCYLMMLWMILLAFKETEQMSFIDALTIFTVGGIALVMPSPGGAGTYHTMVPLAMVYLCGLNDSAKGIAFATIFHGWQTIIVIILGMIGLIVINKHKAHDKPAEN